MEFSGIVMPRNTTAPCVFLPSSHRENVPAGSVIHEASSYGDYPLCTLSPLWVHGGIPVRRIAASLTDRHKVVSMPAG